MIDKIQVIVGLGNPGKKYASTYHNVGQQFLSTLTAGQPFTRTHKLFSALKIMLSTDKEIWLVRPETYMNTSGQAVRAALKHFRCQPQNLLVVHDEFDLPIGQYRVSANRGSAGHHGVQSIIDCLKTKNFSRVRIGIATHSTKALEVVLSNVSKTDQKLLQGVFDGIREKVIEKK